MWFAGADPLAAAAASGSSAASAAVPAALPHHFVPPGQEHPLVAMAQNYERMCAEMLSRPPYNTDAILAQQVSYSCMKPLLCMSAKTAALLDRAPETEILSHMMKVWRKKERLDRCMVRAILPILLALAMSYQPLLVKTM